MTGRRRHGFRFLGFVALADTLFAVSAGLLLLNPLRFTSPPPHGEQAPVVSAAPPPEVKSTEQPKNTGQSLDAEIIEMERLLTELEASTAVLERRVRDAVGGEQQ